MQITFAGEGKTIPPGGTVVYSGVKNTSATGEASTSGLTTSGTQVGLKLTWPLDYTFPGNATNLTVDLNVRAEYFFLYISNNGSQNISKVYVNYGLQSQTLDNISIPNNNVKYRIGYYKAWSNSNVRLEASNGAYWTFNPLNLPAGENKSFWITAN